MDVRNIEKAAFMFYQMCAMHPEICPHDYEWSWSKTTDEGREEHYRCNICGMEAVEVKHI